MAGLFKKKDIKEEVKEQNKILRGATRDLERDRNAMEREKKRLELEIKKMAKEGNKQACVILAKQLVQIRKQETRSIAATAQISGIKTHTQVMASNMKMADAMKTTTKTMEKMNKIQNPAETARIMQEFEKQNMKMGMTDEMINDTLDGVLEGSDDEAESDAIVNKVLDEIGIEITGKLADAKGPMKGSLATSSKAKDDDVSDADIQDMLNRLKAT